VEKIKALISRSRVPKERAARNAGAILDKGIELAGAGAERLIEILSFGERGGSDHRRQKRRDLPTEPDAVRRAFAEITSEKTGKPGHLAVFNHSRGKNQSWVVIPFLFNGEGREYPGTIKILYDPYAQIPRALVLTVTPDDDGALTFHLPLEGRKILRIFAGERGARAALRGSLGNFAVKLHNMGIEVDDTIYGENSIDGFSPIWEGASVRAVDASG
jgi:hypothetical protein